MRRLSILVSLLSVLAICTGGLAGAALASSPSPAGQPRLLAFGGHFGGGFGSRFGGGRSFGRRSLFGVRRGASRGLFKRIARALAFAYILHLFFSHGGLSILLWIVIIALVIHFVRRRRRRRYAY